MKQCPDCGTAPVNHHIEKISAYIDEMERPLFWLPRKIRGTIEPITASFVTPFVNKWNPKLFKLLAKLHLGTIVYEPDLSTSRRARCVWLEAKRRGIAMWEFRLFGMSQELFVAEISRAGQIKNIVFQGLPRPGLYPPNSLAWVDNKPILKKKLSAENIPTANGDTAFTFRKARRVFKGLQKVSTLFVVKPSTGSRSRHTTTGITNEKDLRNAFKKAKKLSPQVIIEQELTGMVYRGTVIGGKVIGIRRKDPPQVIGDGVHTLGQLIAIENQRPERQGPIYSKIQSGNANSDNIDIDLTIIPKKNAPIILSNKTSIANGGGSTDVTDMTHPETITLLEKIATILKDPIVGADFIVSDISKSWNDPSNKNSAKNINAGIIECNSLPFIDVHLFPLTGKPRDTAGALWDLVNTDFF